MNNNLKSWITGVFILTAILIVIRAQKKGNGVTSILDTGAKAYANTVQTLQGRGTGNSQGGIISNLGNSFGNALSGLNVTLFGNSGNGNI